MACRGGGPPSCTDQGQEAQRSPNSSPRHYQLTEQSTEPHASTPTTLRFISEGGKHAEPVM